MWNWGLTVGGVHPQVDGNWTDSFIVSGHAIRLGFDLLADFIEVRELLSFTVQELCILCSKTQQPSHLCNASVIL